MISSDQFRSFKGELRNMFNVVGTLYCVQRILEGVKRRALH